MLTYSFPHIVYGTMNPVTPGDKAIDNPNPSPNPDSEPDPQPEPSPEESNPEPEPAPEPEPQPDSEKVPIPVTNPDPQPKQETTNPVPEQTKPQVPTPSVPNEDKPVAPKPSTGNTTIEKPRKTTITQPAVHTEKSNMIQEDLTPEAVQKDEEEIEVIEDSSSERENEPEVNEGQEEVVKTHTEIKTTNVVAKNNTSTTFIVGISLFGLLVLVLISGGLYWGFRKKRKYY